MSENQHNLPEFSVSEISYALKKVVEENFSYVRVRGELSGVKIAGSGHMYAVLKDENAAMDAVCWRGVVSKLALRPEDGLDVICVGKLTTYPGRSRYQIVIESMELAGQGALLKMIEERKKKLAAEGLFDESRKRALPFLPQTIAVITSPTGAVIRDILHRISDRFPRPIQLYPVQVQGDEAARQIVQAFQMIERHIALDECDIPKPDLVILARGGGSIEDLMAFQEEVVVRAVANCSVPVISAIGHETDVSLCDFAADWRAPTPTGAAEKAVPERRELAYKVSELDHRLKQSLLRLLDTKEGELEHYVRLLPKPKQLVEELAQKLDDRSERFLLAIKNYFEQQKYRLDTLQISWTNLKQFLIQTEQQLDQRSQQLVQFMREFVSLKYQYALPIFTAIKPERAISLIEAAEQKYGFIHQSYLGAVERHYAQIEQRFMQLVSLLESYSYQRILDRGFALIYDEANDKPIQESSQLQKATPQEISVQFKDGKVSGVFSKKAEKKPSKKSENKSSQLKLF